MEQRINLGKNNICVLGGGSWGTAISMLLAENGFSVLTWEFMDDLAIEMQETRENRMFMPGMKLPDNIEVTNDIERAAGWSDIIVFSVPSHVVRIVAGKIGEYISERKKYISATKGIEIESLKRMSQVYKEVLPDADDDNIAVLSGPSFAAEVCRKFPTAIVAGSKNDDLIKDIQKIFMNSYFRVYGNNDITGVELGGSLKNVMAIAAGIVDGVGYGDNTKSALITRGIAEMTRLGMRMGSEMMTFAGLSGVGDLILTCMGKLSRNLHVGKEIGSGKKLETILEEMIQVAEGVKTADAVHKLSSEMGVETPIMEKVYEVLFNGKEAGTAIEELMLREAKAEH